MIQNNFLFNRSEAAAREYSITLEFFYYFQILQLSAILVQYSRLPFQNISFAIFNSCQKLNDIKKYLFYYYTHFNLK